MIKYFKNGVLQAETQDVPQDCGKIRVTVSLEEEMDGVNYYLEFSCPRNVKYISQRLVRIADKEYEVILPRGITEYTGEVYVQMVIMSIEEESLLSRSLIARDPLFVIKESILASVALDNEGKQDFFDYALTVVGKVENAIDELQNKLDTIPNLVGDKVNETFELVNTTMSNYKNLFDGEISSVNTTLGEHGTTLDTSVEKIATLENGTVKLENVANEYNETDSGIYNAKYINNSFGKRIYRESGSSMYTTGSGFAKIGFIDIPVSGKLILTISTIYLGVQVKKLGIRSRKFSDKNMAANDARINEVTTVTLVNQVTAGEIYDIYVEAMESGEDNRYDYDFIILEE